jgi:hypothetical protein
MWMEKIGPNFKKSFISMFLKWKELSVVSILKADKITMKFQKCAEE